MHTPALLRRIFGFGAAFALVTPVPAQNSSAPVTPAPRPTVLKDAEGRTLRRAPTGHITNYYEDKVGDYALPYPLTLADGRPVRDAQSWFNERRPELMRLYEGEIFGRVPAGAPPVRFEVVVKKGAALGGTTIRQHLRGHFGDEPGGPAVNVMIYRAPEAVGPLPLVLHITFGGDPDLPPLPPPPGTASPSRRFNDMGPVEAILSRGYAYAIVRYAEIQPDRANSHKEGVIGLALQPDQEKPAPDEWGAISAWAWGLSRIMDYLETDPAIDAKRVALVGHSRLGKTVLWAGATDPRFALIYSSQSGEMGAALSRRDFGESVDDMAANFGYQFAGNLQKYAGCWNDMPHEGHLLVALNAPRPVFVSAADGDLWSDPRGQFLSLVAAGPVWRLLGQDDLGTTEMPALDIPVATGKLAYLVNKGPHVVSKLDWQTFLDFADRHLPASSKR